MPGNAEVHDARAAAPTITVRGDAVVRVEPDEAVLWITLSALAAAPGPALADVSARSGGLVALLDEIGVPKADRSTTGVTVFEDVDHTPQGRRTLGHRATSQVAVRLTAPDLIGLLVARATDDMSARIDGPHWQIAPGNPARLEAARRAAADARRKAEAYAEGVGATLGPLVRMAEPDNGPVFAKAGVPHRVMAADAMHVQPGEHEVAASIVATFELHPG
jgi:uncharacterized protein YggE